MLKKIIPTFAENIYFRFKAPYLKYEKSYPDNNVIPTNAEKPYQ